MSPRAWRLVLPMLLIGLASLCLARPAGLDRTDARAWQWLLEGDVDQALQALERRTGERNPSAHAWGGLGLARFMRDDPGGAHDSFVRAAGRAADTPEGPLYLGLADITAKYAADPHPFEELCRALSQRDDDVMGTGRMAGSLLLQRLLNQNDTDGARAVLASSGLIDTWALALPFSNDEGRGFDSIEEPERGAALDATYSGRHGATVAWQPLATPTLDGIVRLDALVDPADMTTAYAVTYLLAEEEHLRTLAIGHAGATKVWVNGAPVYANPDTHPLVPDQWIFGAQFQPGWNQVLVKVCNRHGPWGFCLRQLPVGDMRPMTATVEPERLEQAPVVVPNVVLGAPPPPRSPAPAVAFHETLLRADADEGWASLALAVLAAIYRHIDHLDLAAYEHARNAATTFPQSSLPWRLAAFHGIEVNERVQAARRAIQADPNDAIAGVMYYTQFVDRTDYRLALESLRLEAQAPNASPRLMHVLGRYHERESLPAPAYRAHLEAASHHPHWAEPRRRAAQLAEELSYPVRERLDLLEQLTTLDHADDALFAEYVTALLAAGQAEQARATVAQRHRVAPWSSAPALALAAYWRAVERPGDAARLLKQRVVDVPWRADLWRELGLAHHALDDNEAAQAAWRRSLALSGSDALVQDYLERLRPRVARFYDRYWLEPEDLEPVDDPPADAGTLTLLDQQVTRVHPDGAYTEMVREVGRILTQSGARYYETRNIHYAPERQTIRVVRARVTRADGSVFHAQAPVSRSILDPGSRVYGDYRVQQITFPGLEVGATIDLAYERVTMGNVYADYFGQVFYCGGLSPTLRSDYVVLMPPGRPLYHVVGGGLADTLRVGRVDEDNVVAYRWRHDNLPMLVYEPGMPPHAEVAPSIMVSTFRDWDEMASWYWNLSRTAYRRDNVVDERLRDALLRYIPGAEALAGQPLSVLLEQPWTDEQKVAAVNRFVNSDIRYLSLAFGVHGYKPHAADRVCSAAYGDCKDKAVLAVTMLQALDIPAAMALVRTRDRGEVDYSLPSLNLFDHAIYYLPNLGGEPRWIDGTAAYHGTRELPWGDQGVNALVIHDESRHEFIRTPMSVAADNGGAYTNLITLTDQGHATVARRSVFAGLYNPTVRATYHNRERRREGVERLWGGRFPGSALLRMETSDLDDFEAAQWLDYDLHVPHFARQQPDELDAPITFFPVNATNDHAVLAQRRRALTTASPGYPWHRLNRYTLTPPQGYVVDQVPDSVDITTPFGKLYFAVESTAPQLTWVHDIIFEATRVEPADYQAFRGFCARIDELDKQRFVFRKAP